MRFAFRADRAALPRRTFTAHSASLPNLSAFNRRLAHETSVERDPRRRLTRLCDRGCCAIDPQHSSRLGQSRARRAGRERQAICLSIRFTGVQGPGAKGPDAALHGAGSPRLPQTGDRSKDRRSAKKGLCEKLRARPAGVTATGAAIAVAGFSNKERLRGGSEAGGPAAILAEISRRALVTVIGRGTVIIGEGAGQGAGPIIVIVADLVRQPVGPAMVVAVMGGPRLRQVRCQGEGGQQGGGREEGQSGHLDSPARR